MAPEARVYYNLFLVFRFRKFDEEDLRGEVIYVGDSESDKGIREFMSDYLRQLASECHESRRLIESQLDWQKMSIPSRPETRTSASCCGGSDWKGLLIGVPVYRGAILKWQ